MRDRRISWPLVMLLEDDGWLLDEGNRTSAMHCDLDRLGLFRGYSIARLLDASLAVRCMMMVMRGLGTRGKSLCIMSMVVKGWVNGMHVMSK